MKIAFPLTICYDVGRQYMEINAKIRIEEEALR